MDWIRQAFEKASEESEEVMEANRFADFFMEECAPTLLDGWCKTQQPGVLRKIEKIMCDEELSLAFYSMCASFLVSGYINGKKHCK